MKYYRMSFRVHRNNKPIEVWEQCKKQGIAAMGYYYENGESIVGNCSKINEEEFDDIWRASGVHAPSAQSSLRHIAFHMEKDDIIYAKQGTSIVGKGTVADGIYRYNKAGIVNQDGVKWEHYIEVNWDDDFKPFTLNLGANPNIVLELNQERIEKIREMEST